MGITSIAPKGAYPGDTVSVVVKGYGFKQFPDGLLSYVDSLPAPNKSQVVSDNKLELYLAIPATTPPGTYDLTVVGNVGTQEVISTFPFQVYAPPQVALTGITPSTAYNGQTVQVRVYGSGFSQVKNLIFHVDGMTTSNVRVLSDEALSAEIRIPEGLAADWYAASVQGTYGNGMTAASNVLKQGIRVVPPLVLRSITPRTGYAGEKVEVRLHGQAFSFYDRLEFAIGPIQAQSVRVLSDEEASAVFVLPSTRAATAYDVTLTGYVGDAQPYRDSLKEGFVLQPPPAPTSPPPTPTATRPPSPTATPTVPPPPPLVVAWLENVTGYPDENIDLHVHGSGFLAPQEIRIAVGTFSPQPATPLADDVVAAPVYIPWDAAPGWYAVTVEATYPDGHTERQIIPQGFQVVEEYAPMPWFDWSAVLGVGTLAGLLSLYTASRALKSFRRKRWQKQATDKPLPRTCQRGERIVQREKPEIHPGRWKLAAIQATYYQQDPKGQHTQHQMPKKMVKKLDKIARKRLLHGDSEQVQQGIQEIAHEFGTLLLTWQITSRTGMTILLETRLEGGEVEIPFTMYRCTGNGWKKRGKWSLKRNFVNLLAHRIRAPQREESSADYTGYMQREIHTYLKSVVREAARLF
ncbi:MAG: hypothetical protein D6755_03625 [Anaerolineae bacterium]|nr:MAG: hypothetical protein D6755_03625 [Anaerolineae bacterium]